VSWWRLLCQTMRARRSGYRRHSRWTNLSSVGWIRYAAARDFPDSSKAAVGFGSNPASTSCSCGENAAAARVGIELAPPARI
jgi:hypothetical protein